MRTLILTALLAALQFCGTVNTAAQTIRTRVEGSYVKDDYILYPNDGWVLRFKKTEDVSSWLTTYSKYEYLYPSATYLLLYGIHTKVETESLWRNIDELWHEYLYYSIGPRASARVETYKEGNSYPPSYSGFSGARATVNGQSYTYEAGGAPKLRVTNLISQQVQGNIYITWSGPGGQVKSTVQWFGVSAKQELLFTLYRPSTWSWGQIISISVIPGPLLK